MRRFSFAALVIVTLCVSTSLLAQSPAPKETSAAYIYKSPDAKKSVTLVVGDTFDVQLVSDSTFLQVYSCGPYFTHIPSDRYRPIGGISVYAKKDGRGETMALTFAENAIETKIVKNLMRPQVKIVGDGSGPYKWVQIQISPEDYARSGCLGSKAHF